MKGASGMLGDVVVYRQFRGTTVMSNRPKKPKVLTPHQQQIKSRFLLAVAYAKAQIADPILKAKYEPRPGSEFTSAYIAAIADYLRKRKQHDNLLKEEKIVDSKEGRHSVVNLNVDPDNFNDKTHAISHSEDFAEVRLAQISTGLPSCVVIESKYMSSLTLAASFFMPMCVHTVSRAGPTSSDVAFSLKLLSPLQKYVYLSKSIY